MRFLLGVVLLLVPGVVLAQSEPEAPVVEPVVIVEDLLMQAIDGRAVPGEDCPVDLPEGGGWTTTEEDVWEELCAGYAVDMRWYDPTGRDTALPCKPWEIEGDVPENRFVSAEFLHLILTYPRYYGALARPRVRLECAVVAGQLNLANETVVPLLDLHQSHLPQGGLLVRTHFERSLFLIGSRVDGVLNSSAANIAGDLFLRGGGEFGSVELLGAQIGGSLEAIGSTFTGRFNASNLTTGGSVFLRGEAEFGEVVLLHAQIGGNLEADGSTFTGRFNADSLTTGGSVFLRGGAEFVEVDLIGAQIGSALQFGGSTFSDHVDLSNAQIAGELHLSSLGRGSPDWGDEARLTLRNTRAAAVQAEMAAWLRASDDMTGDARAWLPADLSGFRYGQLGGFLSDAEAADAGAMHWMETTNMADADAEHLIDWIEGTRGSNAGYDPQPYVALADALIAAGAPQAARDVRFARWDHRRTAGNTAPAQKFWLNLSRVVVGYSERPWYALYWFAGLVGFGVLMGHVSEGLRPRRFMAKVWYSLENAFPLVDMADDFKSLTHGPPLVDGFFHAQKILGFVLATVLVGALTLLGS